MTNQKPKRAFKPRPPYIVWSPEGTGEPVVAHPAHGPALFAAHAMAKKHPGKTFYVMQCASKPTKVDGAAEDALGHPTAIVVEQGWVGPMQAGERA